jgi:hypothetical protein
MRITGQAVTEYPMKSGPVEYRNSIREADVSGVSDIIDLSSASACSTAYHKAPSRPKNPFPCSFSTLLIRAKTDSKSDIKGIAVLWNTEGGSGRVYEQANEITLKATDQRDSATGRFMTQWYPLSVLGDDHGHFFVTNMGTATLATIEVRSASTNIEPLINLFGELIDDGRLKVDASGITLNADVVDVDVEAITGAGAAAKTLADVVAALAALIPPDTSTSLPASDLVCDTKIITTTGMPEALVDESIPCKGVLLMAPCTDSMVPVNTASIFVGNDIRQNIPIDQANTDGKFISIDDAVKLYVRGMSGNAVNYVIFR